MFRRATLFLVSFAVLALVAAGCVAPARGGAGSPATFSAMLAQVNAQRAANGVPALAACPALQRSAQGHSNEQAATQTMTHDGSGGMVARDQAAGYNGWTALGENVAYGQPSVDQVMSAWMNSPGHRANILNGGYSHFGSGVATGPNGLLYWTQDFGTSGSC